MIALRNYTLPNIRVKLLQEALRDSDRVGYVDTVELFLPLPLTAPQLNQLRVLNDGQGDQFQIRYPPGAGWRKWWGRLRLQRPTEAAIRYLELIAPEHCCRRVDVALDLCTTTLEEAERLQRLLNGMLVQRWHGKRRTNNVAETVYSSRDARTGRNLVVYSDRRSKATRTPCCHLETRYVGRDVCERAGIYTTGDLLPKSAANPTGLDHHKVWQREVALKVLTKPGIQKLEDHVEEMARRAYRKLCSRRDTNELERLRRRRGGLFKRVHEGSLQSVLEKHPAVRSNLATVSTGCLLPEKVWHRVIEDEWGVEGLRWVDLAVLWLVERLIMTRG